MGKRLCRSPGPRGCRGSYRAWNAAGAPKTLQMLPKPRAAGRNQGGHEVALRRDAELRLRRQRLRRARDRELRPSLGYWERGPDAGPRRARPSPRAPPRRTARSRRTMCAGGEAGDKSGGPGPALPAAGLGRLTTPARGKRVEAPSSQRAAGGPHAFPPSSNGAVHRHRPSQGSLGRRLRTRHANLF